MSNKKRHKIVFYSLLFLLIGLATTLLILPADYFNEGESLCVSQLFFNMECYACGMTRAIQHLIHFEFKAAYEFNKLSLVVFPLLVFMIIKELIKMYRKIR